MGLYRVYDVTSACHLNRVGRPSFENLDFELVEAKHILLERLALAFENNECGTLLIESLDSPGVVVQSVSCWGRAE